VPRKSLLAHAVSNIPKLQQTKQTPFSCHGNTGPSTIQLTLAEASQAPDTNERMSGASDRLITSPVCPANEVVCCPVSMSHSALKPDHCTS
jgi:hypothetical protein